MILADANINSAGKVGGDGLADLLVAQVRTSMIIHGILQEQVNMISTNTIRWVIIVIINKKRNNWQSFHLPFAGWSIGEKQGKNRKRA